MKYLTDFLKKTLLAVGILVLGIGTVSQAAEEKKNEGSYWDTSNAPLIYGATAITIPKGTVSSFQVKDARFRVFARDFEDGDLTTELQVSGAEDVDVTKAGTYDLTYSVTDSHGNKTTLQVPVTVTEPTEDNKITVERTLYTLPSDWNMRLAGFTRCNTGDRQILGIYMPAGTSARIRSLDADVNFTVQFITNDSQTEISQTVKSDGQWVELKNTKSDVDYDGVPLITSVMQSPTNQPSALDQINKTYKIELEYDTSVKELDYYHYQDDEATFRSRWKEGGNTYGVIENEVLTMVVPLADEGKMTNYYTNGFKTLDQHLEYYQNVIEHMDAYVGLDFNPENLTDQNIRTKYLVRANAHGAGAAYYSGNHVGINSSSMAAFFEMNWGGLHEFGHGYQGSLGKGDMGLGEVANNILGYYIQTDKDVYFHSGNWLGELAKVEENYNSIRLNGEEWSSEELVNRLYMIINLLNHFEGGDTYAKMFQWYRTQLNNGRTMTNQDAYVEALADLYGVNIIPYMEAWGLPISEDLQDEIYARNLPMVSILKDMVSDESLTEIMAGEDLKEKYSIVDNSIYKNYDITGNATIQIDIDDTDLVQGKMIQVQENGTCIKSVSIDGGKATITDLPVGTYYLQMPIINGYTQGHLYLQVTEGENSCTYTYTSTGDRDYNNYLSLKLQGIYGTFGYVLTFKENYTKATITLGGANMGSNAPYVKIYDADGTSISDEKIVKDDIYFDYSKGIYELDIKPGYVIEVYHPNKAKVQVYSTISGEAQSAYSPTSTTTKYIVTENGLRMESMSDEEQQELQYQVLKKQMVDIIEAYKATATDEELNNKFTNFRKKAEVVSAYNQLKEEDQEVYKDFLNRIMQGGSPVLTPAENLSFEIGSQIDLYTLVSAMDNEDGVIALGSGNTTLAEELDVNVAGTYEVIYQVKDSDGNVSELTIEIEILEDEDGGDTDPDAGEEGEDPGTGEEGGEDPDTGDADEEKIVHYTVRYLLQNIYDDDYTLDTEQQEECETGKKVIAQTDKYEGFILITTGFVPEEDDVIDVYYNRKQCILQFEGNGSDGGKLPGAEAYRYGTEVTIPEAGVTRTSYEFVGWGEDKLQPGSKYVMTGDLTLAAQWKEQPQQPDKEIVSDSTTKEPTVSASDSTTKEPTASSSDSSAKKSSHSSHHSSSSETEDTQTVVSDCTDNWAQSALLNESSATTAAVKTGSIAQTNTAAKTETLADTETEKDNTADTEEEEIQETQEETVPESVITEEEELDDTEIAEESEEQESENSGYAFRAILIIILGLVILGFLLLFIGKRKKKEE